MPDRILFVDTETNGVPADTKASYKNIDNWPTIQQIAWLVYTKEGSLDASFNYAIADSNTSIIPTSDYVAKVILPIHQILDCFLNSLSQCDVIIGHNIDYDVNVILCELHRYGKDTDKLSSMQQFCTMKNSVEICEFDTSNGERFPKLQELYSKLFHQPFANAHDAFCDIRATAQCFWKMTQLYPPIIEGYPKLWSDSQKVSFMIDYVSRANELFKDSNTREEAYKYYEKAAELGNYYSQRRLAWHYLKEPNTRNKAEYLFNLLIDHDASSYIGLARLHPLKEDYYYKLWGDYCSKHFDELPFDDVRDYIMANLCGDYGVTKDLQKVKELCERAIQNGYDFKYRYAKTLKEIGDIKSYYKALSDMVEVMRKEHEGRSPYSWTSVKYDSYYAEVLNDLIECYYYGKGTSKNLKKAWDLIEESVKWDGGMSPHAYYYMGQYYELGLNGITKNYELALKYYDYSSTYAPASLQLGKFYLYGIGCKKDKKKAKEYLLRAKESGFDVDYLLSKANSWF